MLSDTSGAIERFRTVLKLLQSVSTKLLLNTEFLVSMIRAAGIHKFGPFDEYAEEEGGILQDPAQFAGALQLLSKYRIRSAVEIGSWRGHTACFMTAFLLRFNVGLQTTCVDPLQVVREDFGLPVRFHVGTSADVRGRTFDLAFIDGDHSYEGVANDYNNVGRQSPVCMFHDIDNADFNILDPGIYWEHLKQAEAGNKFFEFKYPGKHFMGIGVRVKSS